MSNTELKQLTLLSGNRIFSIPDRVAFEEGLFRKHGIDAVPSSGWQSYEYRAADPRKDQQALFDAAKADTYNMCEWGVLRRLENNERPGKIGYLRPAVVTQALFTLRDDIEEAHDLAHVPVSLTKTTGQHYTTIKFLRGSLSREEIVIEHGGHPEDLLEGLFSGKFGVVALMDPFLSVAIKRGAKLLGSYAYRGAQAFGEDVPEDVRRAYVGAINEAVDLINADRKRYDRYVLEPVGDELKFEDLRTENFRYVHAQPYSKERFDRQYNWLKEYDLVIGNKSFDDIVDVTTVPSVGDGIHKIIGATV